MTSKFETSAKFLPTGAVVLIAIGIALALVAPVTLAQGGDDQAARNKATIKRSFDAWAAGTGGPFDLLADDAPWTIVGRSMVAKTYANREAFLAEVIENYLGFPTGISGMALAGRAFNQALKFGAEIAIPLEGASVSYWASPVEAKLCEGEEVALIGGGNSAGQAVVFLAPKVKRLHLVVRGTGLEASMSRYLIDRIHALPNVDLHVGKEIVALEGDRDGLTAAVFRQRGSGATHTCPLRHLFLFIGADPNAGWLQDRVAVDPRGFVVTGFACPNGARAAGRPALPLETSFPGVFAIGDVRAGPTKRVAAAVGEGAAVVAQIHTVLALQQEHV